MIKILTRDHGTYHDKDQHEYVMLKAATWFRDSHGLFDFDAKRYIQSELYFKNSGFIGRTGLDTLKFMQSKKDQIFEDSDQSLDNSYRELKALISVVKFKNRYF